MELPAPWHPPRGPQVSPAPWPLQPFVLTENFFPAGSPNPGPEQPFQAPPAVVAPLAPGAPRAPPAGLQMAPCGCFFDPRVFHIEWTTTNLPPPATFALTGSASLPGAAPRGPQGCGAPLAWVAPPRLFVPYNPQGRVVAPAPPVLPPSLPSFQHLEGQLRQMSLSGTAVPVGAPVSGGIPLGSNVPMGGGIIPSGDVPPGNSLIPNIQAIGDSPESPDMSLPEEVLLEEAMRLFDCSLGAGGGSQDSPSSVPMPEDPNNTSPCYDISSLWLPEEMLSSDYSVPEASSAILSMEHLDSVRMNPEEPRWDPPPPQANTFQPNARPEKKGKKRRNSSLPKKGSKRKTSTASAGVGGQH